MTSLREKLRSKLLSFIEGKFKVWGVAYETDLPPEFVITEHAEKRLLERLRVSRKKLDAVVVKAWYTKDVPSTKVNRATYYHPGKNKRYREMMGYTWVFSYGRDKRPYFASQKVLITIF